MKSMVVHSGLMLSSSIDFLCFCLDTLKLLIFASIYMVVLLMVSL